MRKYANHHQFYVSTSQQPRSNFLPRYPQFFASLKTVEKRTRVGSPVKLLSVTIRRQTSRGQRQLSGLFRSLYLLWFYSLNILDFTRLCSCLLVVVKWGYKIIRKPC